MYLIGLSNLVEPNSNNERKSQVHPEVHLAEFFIFKGFN
jgi:hypothetical protein